MQLIFIFAAMLLSAIFFIIYPLRKINKKYLLLLILSTLLIAFFGYCYLGHWSLMQEHFATQNAKKQMQKLLTTVNGVDGLVNNLKNMAQIEPSGKAWFLLGRLYVSQNKWSEARDAFAHALKLQPEDQDTIINYVRSLLQTEPKDDIQAQDLLKQLFLSNPDNPDALAMLAIINFRRQDYRSAIYYWQQLLKLVPVQSEEAKMLRQAITKAQQKVLYSSIFIET